MKSKAEYCKKTGKFRYSSEAKAMRAVGRYEDIKRCYYCPYCDGFHTTSIGVGLAMELDIIDAPDYTTYSSEDVQKEIDRLNKIIKSKDGI